MKFKNEDFVPECECKEVHPEIVKKSKAGIPDDESIFALSDLFKVFADTTRLEILFALERGPMCGCDLAEALGITRSAVSYQLKALRDHDLVRFKREGKNITYFLADSHVQHIIDCALEHINE